MTYDKDELSRIENMYNIQWYDNPKTKVSGFDDEFIYLDDVVTADSDGHVMEAYRKIGVKRNCARHKNNAPMTSGIEYSIEHLRKEDLILPSMPLTINFLTCCHESYISDKTDGDTRNVLGDFLDWYFTNQGMKSYLTNSIIDYDDQKIKHYPLESSLEVEMGFIQPRNEIIRDIPERDRLKNTFDENYDHVDRKCFLVDIMGLEDPKDFRDVAGDYGLTIIQPLMHTREKIGICNLSKFHTKFAVGAAQNQMHGVRGVKIIEK